MYAQLQVACDASLCQYHHLLITQLTTQCIPPFVQAWLCTLNRLYTVYIYEPSRLTRHRRGNCYIHYIPLTTLAASTVYSRLQYSRPLGNLQLDSVYLSDYDGVRDGCVRALLRRLSLCVMRAKEISPHHLDLWAVFSLAGI